jgi:ABC-type polar amino acid transport system ATPase subunit
MGFARDAADEVIFMDQGRIVERSESEQFFTNPSSPRAKEFIDRIVHKL